jgi:uncharacterized protein
MSSMGATPLPVTHVAYLHGFRSSPQSTKARLMAQVMVSRHPRVQWWCPQLPPSPREAVDLVLTTARDWPAATTAVIGSSLGGFYATCAATRLGCRAVLLNPAVHPARDLARYVGEQTAFHDPSVRFTFEPAFVDELRALEREAAAGPDECLAVIAKGDELLDWREMTARYPEARIKLLAASDHGLSDFEQHLPDVLGFLGLR